MKQINSSFGSGGKALAMNEGEFASFMKSNIGRQGMPICKAAIYSYWATALRPGVGNG